MYMSRSGTGDAVVRVCVSVCALDNTNLTSNKHQPVVFTGWHTAAGGGGGGGGGTGHTAALCAGVVGCSA